MRRHILIAVVCSLLPAASALAASVDEASAQVRAAWEKHTSMRAKVSVEAGPPTGTTRIGMHGEGPVISKRADGAERYKSLIRVSFSEPMNAAMQVETLFDGEAIQLTNEVYGQSRSRKAEVGVIQGAVPPGGGLLLDALSKETKLELAPDTKIGEAEAFVFEGMVKKGDSGASPVARIKACVDKESGALLRLELYESPAVLTAVIEQKDFEWDVELDANAFEPAKVVEPSAATPSAAEPPASTPPAVEPGKAAS